MFVIALTGGIGSGKTTVSDIFKSKNIPVIDTDIISREITQYNKPAYTEILNEFGQDIIDSEKQIDRSKLRQLVFSSDEKRLRLESILHPLIWNEVLSQLASVTAPYCIIVIPLLFETFSQKKLISLDRILVVDAPEEIQIQRTKNRDNTDDSVIKNIMKSQVSRQTRLDSADDIISNTSDIEQLNREVDKLHEKYLSLSK
jgi:dephospho-CoA kinase